jgi:immunity protein Imm1 of predicted polymorphic toxin system
MSGVASWLEGRTTPIELATLRSVLDRATVDAAERPIIVALRAEGAEITVVVGDPTGTALVYFPPGYEDVAVGSLHSVGDREAADADRWEPPLVAYYFTHHSEFPRWSVIPLSHGQRALEEFLDRPSEPPRSITWGPD